MVSTVSTTINPKTTAAQGGTHQNPKRPPLLPSDPGNALAPRRLKSREVTSRYLSSSSSSSTPAPSKRCVSPLVPRAAATPTPTATSRTPSASAAIKRSQSAERRRPVTPRPNALDSKNGNGVGVVSAAQKMLFTSTRSLSVSFQGESFSLPVTKAKPSPSPSIRKGTPERRKAATPGRRAGCDQTENSKPVNQQLWPGRSSFMSSSVDMTDERKRLGGSRNVVRALQSCMVDQRASFDGKLSLDSSNAEGAKELESATDRNSANGSTGHSDPLGSDTESSVSSASSTSVSRECNGGVNGNVQARGPRGIVVPARFWQETTSRLRRQNEPGSPVSSIGLKSATTAPKLILPKKLSNDSPVSSPKGVLNSRGLSSPIRVAARPSSPSKFGNFATSSPLRGVSPSRVRNGVGSGLSGNLSNAPSVLSFAVDVRRGKIGENRIVDAHVLRLVYNRLLQWRFINARADATLSVQTTNAERSLYNAWASTSKLRQSVRAKRTELQMLRQYLKLASILKGQILCLEDCGIMDQEFSSSLLGATEALRASTLRLPVVSGAKVDVRKVKEGICSALDVMQAMASSICALMSKVDGVNDLVAELAKLAVKEHALLDQCKGLLSTIATLQVTHCSLRTHLLQLQQVSTGLTAHM